MDRIIQIIIVAAVVGGAAFFLVRAAIRRMRGQCGCGCGSAPKAKPKRADLTVNGKPTR